MSDKKLDWDIHLYIKPDISRYHAGDIVDNLLLESFCPYAEILNDNEKGTPIYVRVEGKSHKELMKIIHFTGTCLSDYEILGPKSDIEVEMRFSNKEAPRIAFNKIFSVLGPKVREMKFSDVCDEVAKYRFGDIKKDEFYKLIEDMKSCPLESWEVTDLVEKQKYKSKFHEFQKAIEDEQEKAREILIEDQKPMEVKEADDVVEPTPPKSVEDRIFENSYIKFDTTDDEKRYILKGLGFRQIGLGIDIVKQMHPDAENFELNYRDMRSKKGYSINDETNLGELAEELTQRYNKKLKIFKDKLRKAKKRERSKKKKK